MYTYIQLDRPSIGKKYINEYEKTETGHTTEKCNTNLDLRAWYLQLRFPEIPAIILDIGVAKISCSSPMVGLIRNWSINKVEFKVFPIPWRLSQFINERPRKDNLLWRPG